jgi:hypothetical protein
MASLTQEQLLRRAGRIQGGSAQHARKLERTKSTTSILRRDAQEAHVAEPEGEEKGVEEGGDEEGELIPSWRQTPEQNPAKEDAGKKGDEVGGGDDAGSRESSDEARMGDEARWGGRDDKTRGSVPLPFSFVVIQNAKKSRRPKRQGKKPKKVKKAKLASQKKQEAGAGVAQGEEGSAEDGKGGARDSATELGSWWDVEVGTPADPSVHDWASAGKRVVRTNKGAAGSKQGTAGSKQHAPPRKNVQAGRTTLRQLPSKSPRPPLRPSKPCKTPCKTAAQRKSSAPAFAASTAASSSSASASSASTPVSSTAAPSPSHGRRRVSARRSSWVAQNMQVRWKRWCTAGSMLSNALLQAQHSTTLLLQAQY